MGIGWSLHNRDGTQILHGSGAIHPTQSPTEAEAEALRLAVLDLRRLGYSHVTFCGDLKLIYDTLQRCALRGNNASWKYLPIATYLADVLKISKLCSFNFIHISRDANDIADRLAKQARCNGLDYVICWTSSSLVLNVKQRNYVTDIYNDVNNISSINAFQDLAGSLDELKTTSFIVVLTFWVCFLIKTPIKFRIEGTTPSFSGSVFALLHDSAVSGTFISMDAKMFDTICSRDAISWLPDEVLGKILSLIPTKQAVSTSLLAKKWRTIFRLVDHLELDDSFSLQAVKDQTPGLRKHVRFVFTEDFKIFVDRTLALQCDYPIKNFSLKCHVSKYDERQKACVGRWISNVVGRGVFELDLRMKDPGIHFLPPHLVASKTLVKLTLGTQLCLGQLPSYVSLPSLKSLFIDTIVFYDIEDLCCVLLAGCPVLEELSVHHHDFIATPHTISSPTLKRLSVDYHCPDDVDSASHMSFDLPKLVYLEYSHCALGEYWKLIWRIRNVQTLHLSPDSVHVIYSYCRHGLPVFKNLVNLSFGSKNKRGWRLLANLLKQSTKLETLIVKDLNGYTGDVSMPLNKVTSLHILGYRGTADEVKQLKSFIGEFECLELVQVDVAEAAEDNGKILQSKRDLMMLLGVSLPSKCQFKSVLDELNVRVSGILVIGVLDGTQLLLIILLHNLGKGNKPLAALTTLNHMKEVGIDPSVLHYTTLIDGLSRAGNLEACKYFLDEMVKAGSRPDVVCYTVITGYVVSGELEKAKEMFREMMVIGQLPNVFTYNSMIRGLCMEGEFSEACWLLKEMESRGCNPNFVVYSTLVSYLRKAGKLSEARKVIKEMVKKGHYVHLVSKMMKYRR
ncbi:unnamed protein product [Arabidopsis thaliana]|uniref:F-box domain-containing protein n=1 Tax=Arabidopsis thaliana TaxID=3702 RepID=A0A5S9XN50_ARATH|nr:unnamed protein product [Arabidopsis thaliana]